MSITNIHHGVAKIVSKQILKSIIGSLNATAIAYARGHLRFNALENGDKAGEVRGYKRPARADEMHIDDYADARAAIDEAANRANAGADMGFAPQMQSGELAERLMNMRNYFAGLLFNMKELTNDNPLTIAETVKFQMDRQPDNNDTLIEALALAVDIDPEILKAAKLKMVTNDAADLRDNAGKIITFLEQFQGDQFDDHEAEANFAALPAHVQYKLYGSAIRSYDKASEKAMMSLLRGKLDAAGDIKMLKAVKAEAIANIMAFTKANRIALNDYMDRTGNTLPTFDTNEVVTDNVRKASDNEVVGARAKQQAHATDAAHARVDEDIRAVGEKALRRVKAAAKAKA